MELALEFSGPVLLLWCPAICWTLLYDIANTLDIRIVGEAKVLAAVATIVERFQRPI
jgi:hypothetical protein